jgi:hypothetical protein
VGQPILLASDHRGVELKRVLSDRVRAQMRG